jgi:hypothetical protein
MVPPLPISWIKVWAIGFGSTMVGSLVWGANASPIKNREEGRALALGGRRLMMANNYQPDSGRSGRGGVRAEARWAGSMWGDAITSYGASNGAAKKSI